MNRWSRIVWWLAIVSTAGWIAGGLLGYRAVDQLTLARHTLTSLVALLALILCHSWIALFSLVSRGLLSRTGAEIDRQLRSAIGIAAVAATVAIVAAVAQFTVSNALFPARLEATRHAIAGGSSVLVLVLALVFEGRALARHGAAVRTLEARAQTA
jgi:uncharacterized membrane protein